MIDFLDSTPCICPLDGCTLHRPPPPPEPSFSGIKCDSPGCFARVRGRTDTRALIRSLTLRAETLGWQCVFFDGEGHHYCPGHVDPDRERLRRFK